MQDDSVQEHCRIGALGYCFPSFIFTSKALHLLSSCPAQNLQTPSLSDPRMQVCLQDIKKCTRALKQKISKCYKRQEPAKCRSKSTHVANTRLDGTPEAPEERIDEKTTQKKRRRKIGIWYRPAVDRGQRDVQRGHVRDRQDTEVIYQRSRHVLCEIHCVP